MKSKHFSANTMEERQDIFQEYFDRDLEHYFDSRISCCEHCYDEFCREWPGTAARDESFQRSGIEISYFLKQSRIQEAFYPEEIELFSKKLECPNCAAALDGVFYIFEHKFLVDEFHLSSIADLASKSPFLLLSHPFAAKVFDVIKRRFETAGSLQARSIWYRGRMAKDVPASPGLSDFGPPPAAKVAEGRYNHAGHAMLYLADSPNTVKGEMRASQPIGAATPTACERSSSRPLKIAVTSKTCSRRQAVKRVMARNDAVWRKLLDGGQELWGIWVTERSRN